MDFETYAQELEEKALAKIIDTCYNELDKTFKKYKNLVHYVTDGNFTTRGGKLDFNCRKKARVIKKQRAVLSRFISDIGYFQDKPLSEDSQRRIYFASMLLKCKAIKYGYCEEAEKLLKISTNKALVGGMCEKDVSEDILTIVDNYAKRSILEEKSYKEKVDELVVGVRFGEYGEHTSKMLPDERINRAYNGATVVRGDMVFKMDGSVETKSK